MNTDQIKEIVETYRRHGWNLTGYVKNAGGTDIRFDDFPEGIGGVPVTPGLVDAAWFSRDSGRDNLALELRLLSTQPIALFESIPLDTNNKEIQNIRLEMESRLSQMAA